MALPEFAGLLPPLSGEQFSALEQDILTNGCYSPIIVDEDMVIIDGHHRQKICAEHNIPYAVREDLVVLQRWFQQTVGLQYIERLQKNYAIVQ